MREWELFVNHLGGFFWIFVGVCMGADKEAQGCCFPSLRTNEMWVLMAVVTVVVVTVVIARVVMVMVSEMLVRGMPPSGQRSPIKPRPPLSGNPH